MDIGVIAGSWHGMFTQTLDAAIMARKAESLGFESFWMPEHTIVPASYASTYHGRTIISDWGDPLIGLAKASAVTEKIKLGTAISIVPEHNPLVQAKQIATLDRVSNGRFIFGIGAGWLKEELEIMGGTWGAKWAQTREAILAMKELWTKEEAEFHGKYYDFPPVMCDPKPVQQPHPPVFIGGNGPRALQRAAEWADGWFPVGLTLEQIRAGRATLDQLAEANGRDPKEIQITVGSYGEAEWDGIEKLEQAGVDRVNVSLGRGSDVDLLDELERIAEIVLK